MSRIGNGSLNQMRNGLDSIRRQHEDALVDSVVADLNKILFAMWETLKEGGATDDDFNRACMRADTDPKYTGQKIISPIYCPKCSRLMQRMDILKCRCPYCSCTLYQNSYSNSSEGLIVSDSGEATVIDVSKQNKE